MRFPKLNGMTFNDVDPVLSDIVKKEGLILSKKKDLYKALDILSSLIPN